MLWNKSKQMGSVAVVVWHKEKGGGTEAQKYSGHFSQVCAKVVSCNKGVVNWTSISNSVQCFFKAIKSFLNGQLV